MATALAEAGARAIALIDVKKDLVDLRASILQEHCSLSVNAYAVDVTDEHAFADVAGKVVEDLGSIDIVVNSAGIVE